MSPKKSTRKSAPEFRKLEPKDYESQKWKNGRGETLQIAADKNTPYRWRLSTAVIPESGPFSSFPGYDRQLVLLDGQPVRMMRKNEVSLVAPRQCFSFKGEEEISAHITQPCRDLNLFTLRDFANGVVHVARYAGKEEYQMPYQGREHFLFVVEGEIEYLDTSSDSQGTVKAGETLWITRPDDVNLMNLRTCAVTPQAIAAWITVHCKS